MPHRHHRCGGTTLAPWWAGLNRGCISNRNRAASHCAGGAAGTNNLNGRRRGGGLVGAIVDARRGEKETSEFVQQAVVSGQELVLGRSTRGERARPHARQGCGQYTESRCKTFCRCTRLAIAGRKERVAGEYRVWKLRSVLPAPCSI